MVTINPPNVADALVQGGMRIRVIDILILPTAGLSQDQIIEELPDLEKEDIEAAIKYARNNLN